MGPTASLPVTVSLSLVSQVGGLAIEEIDESHHRLNTAKAAWRAFLILSLPWAVATYWWYWTQVRPELLSEGETGLLWTIPIACIWVVVNAPLMVIGEAGLIRVLRVLSQDSRDMGSRPSHPLWSRDAIVDSMTVADKGRLAAPWIGVAIAVLAFLTSRDALSDLLPISSTYDLVFGGIVLFQVGFVSAYGIWGVMKGAWVVVCVCRAARKGLDTDADQGSAVGTDDGGADGSDPWVPFTTKQAMGMEEMSTFALRTGVIYSVGSLFVPALLIVMASGRLPPFGYALSAGFIAALLFGGLVAFLVPVVAINRLANDQKDAQLDQLGRTISKVYGSLKGQPASAQEVSTADLYRLLAWYVARQETARPASFSTLVRSFSTLVIPAISAAWAISTVLMKGQ